jgi:hypothetical protein
MTKHDSTEHSRGDKFAQKIKTGICLEIPDDKSPWLVKQSYWQGYSQQSLMQNKSFTEVVWLLIRGELPSYLQNLCLDRLFVMLACPSPRTPQSRAIMNAAIGKTHFEHWLPIGLTVASGSYGGAVEVYDCMRFIAKYIKGSISVKELAKLKLLDVSRDNVGENIIAPGFGTCFGHVDEHLHELLNDFSCLFEYPEMKFSQNFVSELSPNGGWRLAGIIATILSSLGFSAAQAVGLFQMAIMPGLLAYADEKSGKSLTEMPFLDDKQYTIKMPSGEIK